MYYNDYETKLDIVKEKYLQNDLVLAFNNYSEVKENLNEWVIDMNRHLYVKTWNKGVCRKNEDVVILVVIVY